MSLVFARGACHLNVTGKWPKYLRRMRGVLSRHGRQREEIEDLMQDALVRLLEYCERGAVEETLARVRRVGSRGGRERSYGSHHAKLREFAPYAAMELVLPGGSLMALGLRLCRRQKKASLFATH